MKNAAIRIHDLSKSLGIQQAEVVGHDIGLMVAYAYAALYPSEVKKLVLMDAFLPGVPGWEPIYDDPGTWHFRFNGPTPEALVKGRERTYFEYFWNDLAYDKTHSIPETDRQIYTAAYSRPGKDALRLGLLRSMAPNRKRLRPALQTRLTMPVLSIGGDHSLGGPLGDQAKLVATNVTVIVLKNTGHWILEEQPKQTTDALQKFL